MINKEVSHSKSQIYFSDNSRKKYGRGQRKLTMCVEAFLRVADGFFHSPKKIGTTWPKSKGLMISLSLCGEKRIKDLNREFRKKNKVTDVLSFASVDSLRTVNSFEIIGDRILIGDIVICRDVTLKQAKRFNITYEQELIHLMVHGFLHLCGFDHEISLKEEIIMEKFESELVNKIYKNLGYI